jgi:hypothetical protein
VTAVGIAKVRDGSDWSFRQSVAAGRMLGDDLLPNSVARRTRFWGHAGRAGAVVFDPDGVALIRAGDDGTVRTWDARTGHVNVVVSQQALRRLPGTCPGDKSQGCVVAEFARSWGTPAMTKRGGVAAPVRDRSINRSVVLTASSGPTRAA